MQQIVSFGQWLEILRSIDHRWSMVWGVRWPTHEVSTPKITICKNCV